MSKKNVKLMLMLDEKGSNQRKLAELLGCSYPAIQKKVRGAAPFKDFEIAKIKEHFNLSLAEIEEIFLKG